MPGQNVGNMRAYEGGEVAHLGDEEEDVDAVEEEGSRHLRRAGVRSRAWLCSRRTPPELQRSASPAQTAGIPAKETDSQTVTREARERARWPRAAHGICGTPPYPLVDSSAREIQLYRVRMQSPATAHKRRESEAGVHGHARTSFGPPRPSRWPAICTCPTSPSATHLRVGRRERALGATLEQTWKSPPLSAPCV